MNPFMPEYLTSDRPKPASKRLCNWSSSPLGVGSRWRLTLTRTLGAQIHQYSPVNRKLY